MWAMSSSPLLVSTDIRNLTAIQKAVLQNPEVIAVDQQPTAGDVVDKPLCQTPPASTTTTATRSVSSDDDPQWFVAHNVDALPELPHEEPGVFHEFGATANGTACREACAANASCSIYEWSAKSSNCWWRLDGKWVPRSTELRESGCILGRVHGCGQTPPPSPSPPPSPPVAPGECQVWAKPLVETTYRWTVGWSALRAHHAVVLLNLGESSAVVSANLTAVAPGSTVMRDVWINTTERIPATGVYSTVVPPHGSVLLRVWQD
jgi:hypothetical protein